MKKKRRRCAGKGSAYERETCYLLSDWWEPGRQDIFWRSHASGARATTRRKKGKATFGQCGDVAATDPCGMALIRMFTIEIKRGYQETATSDLLDKPETAGISKFDEWIEQAMESWRNSKSKSWCIISKRNRREAIMTMPKVAYNMLRQVGAFSVTGPMPMIRLRFMPYSMCHKVDIVVMTLEAFLRGVRRTHIERSLKEIWP